MQLKLLIFQSLNQFLDDDDTLGGFPLVPRSNLEVPIRLKFL